MFDTASKNTARPGRISILWLLIVAAVLVFVYLLLLTRFDMPAFRWRQDSPLRGRLKDAVRFFRCYAQVIPLLMLMLTIWLADHSRRVRVIATGLFGMLLVAIPVWVGKLTIIRYRPSAFEGQSWQDTFGGFFPGMSAYGQQSLPSGDAAAAFCLSVVLAGFYPRLRPVFYILAGGCAVSRFFTRSHFPSDIFFGMVIGIVVGCVTLRLSRRMGFGA